MLCKPLKAFGRLLATAKPPGARAARRSGARAARWGVIDWLMFRSLFVFDRLVDFVVCWGGGRGGCSGCCWARATRRGARWPATPWCALPGPSRHPPPHTHTHARARALCPTGPDAQIAVPGSIPADAARRGKSVRPTEVWPVRGYRVEAGPSREPRPGCGLGVLGKEGLGFEAPRGPAGSRSCCTSF